MSTAPPIPTPPSDGKRPTSMSGNVGMAMFSKAFYLLTRLILPPLVLAHITAAEYGLWAACFVMIMYIGLTDAGISNVYVRFTAQFHARGDVQAINRLLSTGVLSLLFLATMVLIALYLLLPYVASALKISADHRQTANVLIMGTASMFLLDLTLGAYCYLLHGLQRIREEQTVAIIGYVIELLLIAALLQLGWGVYALLAAFVLRYAFSLSTFIFLAHRFLPGLSIGFKHFDRSSLKLFMNFGAKVQLSSLAATAFSSIDRVLAGMMLGPKGIALFELGAKLPISAIAVPGVISQITMPAASRHEGLGDQEAVRQLYRQASRAIGLLAAYPLAFIAIFSEVIARTWLGANNWPLLPAIMTCTALASHLHIITGPGSAVFRAKGQVHNEFVYHGLRLACLAAALTLAGLLMPWGPKALMVGLSAGTGAAALIYMQHNQRRLGLPASGLLREAITPSLLAYPLAYLAMLLWQTLMPDQANRWEAMSLLIVAGLVYAASLTALYWVAVLHSDEKQRVSQHWQGVFVRRAPSRSSLV